MGQKIEFQWRSRETPAQRTADLLTRIHNTSLTKFATFLIQTNLKLNRFPKLQPFKILDFLAFRPRKFAFEEEILIIVPPHLSNRAYSKIFLYIFRELQTKFVAILPRLTNNSTFRFIRENQGPCVVLKWNRQFFKIESSEELPSLPFVALRGVTKIPPTFIR